MQTRPLEDTYGGRAGIVQWVVPPPSKRATNSRNNQQANYRNDRCRLHNNGSRQQTNTYNSRQATTSDDSHDYNNSSDQNLNDSGICDDLSFGRSPQSSNNNNNSDDSDNLSRPILDLSVCRTISTFVGIHLRDLSERQQRINQTRSKVIIAKLNNQKQPESSIGIYIAPKDDIKFKVREEQTKAIESIKQLTNYLKELSYLKQHCDSSSDSIDDEVVTKLSELRTEIIQALNDFVLSNSDIEIPILDSEVYEYDLCMDARLTKIDTNSTQANIDGKLPNSFNSKNRIESRQIVRRQPTLDSSPSPSIDDSSDNRGDESLVELAQREAAHINLEKRKREVQKLEQDTVELKRLFSEFYNLVREQGEKLETIEENIVISTQGVSQSQHNLKKAAKSLSIIMPMTGCMVGALVGGPLGLAVGGKVGGITVGCASSLLGLFSSYSIQRCVAPSTIARNLIKLD